MLNGSGSTDADGTITTYTWNFGDGSGGSGMSMQHAYATPGTYAATLTVTDNLGATNSDTATVSVVDGTWVRAIGGASSDSGMAVAVDAGGNVVTGGAFYDAMTVGSTLLTSAGNSDVFLVKYSQTGSVLWARRLGGTGDDSVQSLAIDPTSGDVVMAGWFTGTTTIDTTSFVANGPQDILLAKFDGATGALRWAKQFGGIYEDVGNGVAVDTSGNILLTGSIKNRVTFGGAFLQTPQVTDTDVFVAKFTSAGAHVWSENFTNTAGDEGTSIAVDRNGNIVVGGWFTGSLYFGTTQLFAAHGMPDGFVARLNSAGTPTWSRDIGAGTPDDYDLVYGVAMDTSGNMLVTGRVGGAVNFGGGLLSALGAADAYVAKYSPTGAHVWSRRMGGISPDYGYGVAVDASNNVLVTGVFKGTADFGGVVLTAPGTGFNAFVAKYTAAGGTVWARQFGSTGDDLGHAVAVAPTGHPLVAGQFNGPTTFDGIPLSGVGLADAFLYHGKP